MKAEELINLPENIERLNNYGDEYLIKCKMEKDIANTKNYKKHIFYHASFGCGEIGVGKGLYLGKDKTALDNFYNCDGEKGGMKTYKGNPKFIDLVLYKDYEKFENEAKIKFPNLKCNEHLNNYCISLGFDGIRYFDPIATGEEFVLYNTNKVKLIKIEQNTENLSDLL